MLTVACEETNVAGLLGPYLLVFKTDVATVASHTRFQSSICYITICFLKTCLGKLTCYTIFWQKLVLHGNKVWPRFNFTRYLVNETHRYGALVASEISKKNLTHEFAINTFKLIPLPRHAWKKPFPSHYMLSVFQVLILYLVQKLYYLRSTRQGEPHPC